MTNQLETAHHAYSVSEIRQLAIRDLAWDEIRAEVEAAHPIPAAELHVRDRAWARLRVEAEAYLVVTTFAR